MLNRKWKIKMRPKQKKKTQNNKLATKSKNKSNNNKKITKIKMLMNKNKMKIIYKSKRKKKIMIRNN